MAGGSPLFFSVIFLVLVSCFDFLLVFGASLGFQKLRFPPKFKVCFLVPCRRFPRGLRKSLQGTGFCLVGRTPSSGASGSGLGHFATI